MATEVPTTLHYITVPLPYQNTKGELIVPRNSPFTEFIGLYCPLTFVAQVFRGKGGPRSIDPNASLSYIAPCIRLCDISLRLCHVLRTPPRIDEKILALVHILDLDLLALSSTDFCKYACWCEQLQSISQADLLSHLADFVFCCIRNVQLLGLDARGDDRLDLCWAIGVSWDNEEAGE